MEGIKAARFILRETTDDVGSSLSMAILKSVSDFSTTVNHLDQVYFYLFKLLSSGLWRNTVLGE